MTYPLGKFHSVVVACDCIGLYAALFAELHESLYPFSVLYTAYRRSAHLETAVVSLDSLESLRKQFEVFLHIGIFPETRQIRLVPDLYVPVEDLLTVTPTEMFKQSDDHICPHLVILRGSCVALPVENGLSAAGKLFGHETQFQIRTYAQFKELVEYAVDVGVVVLDLGHTVLLIFLINSHIVREQTVSSDVLEAYLLLYHFKLRKIFLSQRKTQPACAYAVIHIVIKIKSFVVIHYYFFHKDDLLI